MVFLKQFFENINFEKSKQTIKKKKSIQNYPACKKELTIVISCQRKNTANFEIFVRKGCKDIFAMFKIRGLDVINLHQ